MPAQKPITLLICAYGLLIGTWVVSSPPGAGPDEPTHYIKALASGRGQFLGGAVPQDTAKKPSDPSILGVPPQVLGQVRVVDVPPRMALDEAECFAFKQTVSAGCINSAPTNVNPIQRYDVMATFEPYVYVPAGIVMRLASDSGTALLLGRATLALVSFSLLAVAALLLWDKRLPGFSVLGLMVAVTPMVLYLAGVLSASGPEAASGVCFAAAIIRLTRPEPIDVRVWIALTAGGAVLALSRALGPMWIAIDAAVLAAIVGPQALLVRLVADRRAWAAVGIVSAAIAANLWWSVAFQPRPPLHLHMALAAGLSELRLVPELIHQQVGLFGTADTNMPEFTYYLWEGMGLAVIGLAFLVGTLRQRLILLTLAVGCIASLLFVHGFIEGPAGFGVQGRHTLAVSVLVPLYAGEVIYVNLHRLHALTPRFMVLYAAIIVAVVQFTAVYAAAQRYAVGVLGPIFFLAHSMWQPPLGWEAWLAVAAIAAGLIVLFGARTIAQRDDVSDPAFSA